MQDTKLDQTDETFKKREAEIDKLKHSIIGITTGTSEDGANQTRNREHEEVDPNLTGNIRSTISPRYSFMPSKEFHSQNHQF